MRTQSIAIVATVASALFLGGCPREKEESLTAAEARQALEEAALASEAESLTSSVVEISTNFSIGEAVEQAAMELGNFIESQLPCAEVTLEKGKISTDWGVKPGNCTYEGHTLSGSSSMTISRNDTGDVLVRHEWMDLTNGRVTLNGSADVTWSLAEGSRRVVHEARWTRNSDGKTGVGSGDRTQRTLDGGVLEGISVDGWRSWQGELGSWDLTIDNAEMRWIDPVPQSGKYTLGTPFNDKALSLSFRRIDANTIRVTVASGSRDFEFDVTSTNISEG